MTIISVVSKTITYCIIGAGLGTRFASLEQS